MIMAKQNEFINKIDKHVGIKIYSLRLFKGLSHQELAELIAVTHQQLQKYEKGINRVSIGRLALIAKALGTTVNYFYNDMEGINTEIETTQHQRMCIEVSRNFMRIKNPEHQGVIHSLVKTLFTKESA